MIGVLGRARTPIMNNDNQLPFQRLDAYKVAKELARRVHEAHIGDSELRDQTTRASKSAFLGLCEGLPSDASGIRRRHFDIANNSLHEVIGDRPRRGHRHPGPGGRARAPLARDSPQADASFPASLTRRWRRANPSRAAA